MLLQQNGVVTPHLGHLSIDPALGGYQTTIKKKFAAIILLLKFNHLTFNRKDFAKCLYHNWAYFLNMSTVAKIAVKSLTTN